VVDPRDLGCLCQGCGSRYKIDFNLPDKIWEKIKPQGKQGGLLCGKCIVEKLESLGFGAFELRRL
jgi:hypothetical protein